MEKKEILKKLSPILKGVMLSGIKLNKYGGDLFLIILWKKHSFINQRLERRFFIPNYS